MPSFVESAVNQVVSIIRRHRVRDCGKYIYCTAHTVFRITGVYLLSPTSGCTHGYGGAGCRTCIAPVIGVQQHICDVMRVRRQEKSMDIGFFGAENIGASACAVLGHVS